MATVPAGGRRDDRAHRVAVIRPASVAVHASDLRERWAAQAAEVLADTLRAARVAFVRVDERGDRDPEIVLLERSRSTRSAAAALADFQDCFGDDDPFLALRHADTVEPVEHGWPAMREDARALFARLCWRARIADVLTIYLTDAGRIVGYFLALRMSGHPAFGAPDLRRARTAQTLLATSYAAVLNALPVEASHTVRLAAAALSPRETEVARLLAQGATNKQIAAALSRSPSTVNTHVSRVLAKLGLSNRTQVALVLSATSSP